MYWNGWDDSLEASFNRKAFPQRFSSQGMVVPVELVKLQAQHLNPLILCLCSGD